MTGYCCDIECGDAVECGTISFVFSLQANVAREFGARVYCVGVKDFDKDQVNKGLIFFYYYYSEVHPF